MRALLDVHSGADFAADLATLKMNDPVASPEAPLRYAQDLCSLGQARRRKFQILLGGVGRAGRQTNASTDGSTVAVVTQA